MATVKVEDITIYYEFHGEKNSNTLVIIPGLGTDLTVYKEIINQLSKEFKVLAFDNRGSGRTDKPDIIYTIEMMANDTAKLMRAVGVNRGNILGISLGGRIALELTLKYPDMVNSLILASTSPKVVNTHGFRPMLMKLGAKLGALVKKNPQPSFAFNRQLEASRSYDCSDQLNRIDVSTLILHGEKDNIASYKFAEEMHARIKNSKIITFSGGHYIFLSESKRFTGAIFDFLSN